MPRHCTRTAFRRIGLAVLVLLVISAPASAQQPGPSLPFARLFSVMPPGGKAGTAVEATIGGVDLDECSALTFTHPGIKAEPIPDPMKQGSFIPNKFKITIEANVPIGHYDVRAVSKWGISNPRAFVVGELNEVLEVEPNNDVPQPQKIEINSTVSGTIAANVDVDYFAFAGKKGQRIIVHCAAESIDSRLNPRIELFDAKNNLLAANHRYAGREAFFAYLLPADADYVLRVSEHAYVQGHGGPEFFYRLTVSVGPWITAAHPSVVDPIKPTQITLYGCNLPNAEADPKTGLDKLAVTVAPPDPKQREQIDFPGPISSVAAGLDGFSYRIKNAVGHSNPVLLTYASGPVVLDNEDNDDPEKPQTLTVPCDVGGWMEKKKDRDWYAFDAKANEVFVIDVLAERIGVPIDAYLEIYRGDPKDPKVRQLINETDDVPDTITPLRFNTSTRDPRVRFVAPADGRYLLLVSHRDNELYGGPQFVYTLGIRKEAPDFRLVAVDNHDFNTGAPLVRPGGSQFLDVYCFRHDGFGAEIALTVEGLPNGVTCRPQTLAGAHRHTTLVLTAAPDAAPWTGEIKIKGAAVVNGQTIVREARGACQVLTTIPGANVVAVTRLTRTICLGVADKARFTITPEIQEIAVPAGAPISVKVKVARHDDFKQQIQIFPESQVVPTPPNAPPLATIAPDKDEATFSIPVPPNTAPGTYNLVFRGVGLGYPFNKDPKAPQKPPINVLEGVPPIRVTVYNSVGEVTLGDPNPKLKLGTDTELVVKVNRTNGYTGPFKVSLILPQGFQGVTAAEITIPENANEGKLVLKVPANAALAANPNLIVRAVATIGTINLNHDARLGVTIEK